jgi:hypothetical protein
LADIKGLSVGFSFSKFPALRKPKARWFILKVISAINQTCLVAILKFETILK